MTPEKLCHAIENSLQMATTVEKQIVCPFCKTLVFQSGLNLHLRDFHRQQTLHKCDLCDFACTSRKLLSQHADTHSNRANYTYVRVYCCLFIGPPGSFEGRPAACGCFPFSATSRFDIFAFGLRSTRRFDARCLRAQPFTFGLLSFRRGGRWESVRVCLQVSVRPLILPRFQVQLIVSTSKFFVGPKRYDCASLSRHKSDMRAKGLDDLCAEPSNQVSIHVPTPPFPETVAN